MAEAAHPSRARVAWLIFIGSFLVYQANLRPVASADSLAAALLPFSILLDHSFNLDRFVPALPADAYFLHEKNGHFYSSYPVAQPVMLTPFYLPVCLILNPARWPAGDLILLARIVEKLVAGDLAAASAAIFFLLLDRLTSRRNALVLAAACAFGTSAWATSSQALWQHSGGGLMLALTALALQRWNENREERKFLFLAGMCSGLALMMRPANALLAGAIVLVLLLRGERIRALAVFLPPVVLGGFLTAAYNLWLLADLRGYTTQPFDARFLDGLAGVLFSPSRGLLVYCPFLIFAVVGMAAWRKREPDMLSLPLSVSAAFCLAHLILIGAWPDWTGGYCWGPRLLTEMAPFLVLLILPAIDAVMASGWRRGAFAILLLYSAALQFVGTFCFPNGRWHDTPVSASLQPERFWDWNDNPIGRTIRGGLVLTPHAILLEGALHGKDAAIRKMKSMGLTGF